MPAVRNRKPKQKTRRHLVDILLKMRELRERGYTDGERSAAAELMNQLLLKHNITERELDNASGEATPGVRTGVIELRDSEEWREALLAVIARACVCKAVKYAGAQKVTIIGHTHNLVVAREMFRWLEPEIERGCEEAWSLHVSGILSGRGLNAKIPNFKVRWFRAFHLGAVKGLEAAFAAARKRTQFQVGTRWGLIPLLEKEVERACDRTFPDATPGEIPPEEIVYSYYVGYEFGRSLNIAHRQLVNGVYQVTD